MSGGLKFSDSARAAKFAHWERAGVELVATDFDSGDCSVVGPSVQERRLAEEWLEIKLAEKAAAIRASVGDPFAPRCPVLCERRPE